ncbi:MAG: GC-type dockerin domain-anchored protein [Phycisphaerales bacterium]
MTRLILAFAAVVMASTSAAQVSISFEELGPQPAGFIFATPLRNQIPGAAFAGPGPLDGGAVLNQMGNFGVDARSGEHFLGFNSLSGAMMANGGLPRDPETITFAQAVGEVSIWAAGGFDTNSFTMLAFNAAGVQVGMDQVQTQDWAELRIVAQGIVSIRLTAISGDEGWLYDDLSTGAGCYPDCNADGALTVADFGCFQGKYVTGNSYADCNGNGSLTVADFGCFQGKYVTGCP